MARWSERESREGLRLLRLLMVLSSISPLFVLWAIRGTTLIPDSAFVGACVVLALLPTIFLFLRIALAKKHNDVRNLVVGHAEDHRSHVLTYLFAILMPFYRQTVDAWRDLAAMLVALVFIVFLFWSLNLHYMNLILALRGYRIYTVQPPDSTNPHAGNTPYTLITWRSVLPSGQQVNGLRISNTVYLEAR